MFCDFLLFFYYLDCTKCKFPDFSLTFPTIHYFPWPSTKLPDFSLTFAKSGISLTFPWPLDTLSYVRNLRYEAKEYGKSMRRFWIFWSVDRCHNAHSLYLYQTNTLFNINRHQDCEKIRQSWSPLVLSSVFDNYCSWMEDSERDDESISKYSFSQICVQIFSSTKIAQICVKKVRYPTNLWSISQICATPA